jgi:hypothetical protein
MAVGLLKEVELAKRLNNTSVDGLFNVIFDTTNCHELSDFSAVAGTVPAYNLFKSMSDFSLYFALLSNTVNGSDA